MNEVRGSGVLFLGPGDEIVDPAGLAELGFAVIQPGVTADLGPCALKGCDGRIRQVSIPVQDPESSQRSLHRINVCTAGCGTALALINGAARTQFVADQVDWLRGLNMPDDVIRQIHGEVQ
ncbi:MAG: hypothetical protein PHH01_03455 [Patescibacteria group bacterium]|nr:hypothetical protein [Patescibacteria group bacterium]